MPTGPETPRSMPTGPVTSTSTGKVGTGGLTTAMIFKRLVEAINRKANISLTAVTFMVLLLAITNPANNVAVPAKVIEELLLKVRVAIRAIAGARLRVEEPTMLRTWNDPLMATTVMLLELVMLITALMPRNPERTSTELLTIVITEVMLLVPVRVMAEVLIMAMVLLPVVVAVMLSVELLAITKVVNRVTTPATAIVLLLVIETMLNCVRRATIVIAELEAKTRLGRMVCAPVITRVELLVIATEAVVCPLTPIDIVLLDVIVSVEKRV
jgi:hypothetical protein